MTNLDPLLTSSYHYELPDELIATHPIHPRDHARLLVYNRSDKTITHARFDALESFLPQNCGIIFNDTKVIKARLYGKKESGGAIELLINRPLDAYAINVYIKGRVKLNTLLLFDADLTARITALNEDGSREVNFYLRECRIRFEELLPILEKVGHIPLPPYLGREDNSEDEREYQSVFAHYEGAVAAPTASLHFSDKLFEAVCSSHPHAFVTLHVGSGTFKPVEAEIITDHPMHSEYFDISASAQELLHSDIPLLSIGTTSTRTVEYHVRTQELSGEANLFLHPNNPPQRVNHLLTNFHLPQSTLLMLVASFVGLEETHRIYQSAIDEKYRFFSYGDAMLIL
ncbi:MAG: tRNA preQ1(34) S-adenosylmethionine ribosyltransferase-isomerase QueA [Sulfuricurvum sp. GWF2_44_89]|uniref:tRNA preQ1(34) S-adenosylmethionine ribosyltransferase-isomerase QueA n=1 Tax=Sulfuricurvum TaxID=286130 RepID=UPI0008CFD940|nr:MULTISPECIES: tRNA preQ1(34) S-adenosylmethionine ribosyltransferase-isomerase QueA [Sulfuricurvum]OHD77805.1 MAG: tRNA preQ1(34) S-adenosylmethionine ribosyltransferase-isomerase QueA [Sulfuricurvum sp. GWF2_44_89]OHD91434.1 MAG: tRNA preQ1(34) S-adenosylmethionine ribosyltransferase-isomerase QueA [Sulfuricurvum sp. RIFOXYD2_FULL_44_160]OHD96105.1 MAG: tRNA preQ1(34) S-adenosylmethionine ribosyltransferase-isomerase QueA [Sulfuricurvum sp. RIFOXYD12_FULL_44_77]